MSPQSVSTLSLSLTSPYFKYSKVLEHQKILKEQKEQKKESNIKNLKTIEKNIMSIINYHKIPEDRYKIYFRGDILVVHLSSTNDPVDINNVSTTLITFETTDKNKIVTNFKEYEGPKVQTMENPLFLIHKFLGIDFES